MKTISLLIACIYFSGGEALWLIDFGQVCCNDIKQGLCFDKSGDYYLHSKLPACPSQYKPKFWLYTRKNQVSPLEVTQYDVPNQFSNNRRTVFIVHGWRSSFRGDYILMKDQFLAKEDMNVIGVDWKDGAGDGAYGINIPSANTRSMGALLGMVVNKLRQEPGSNKYMWCVGHSLGAHVCGESRWTSTPLLDRITGLNPHQLQFPKNTIGLTSSSAKQVDVIHTTLILGSPLARGHVDFYINWGRIQPDCFITTDSQCSHNKAITYMINSIIRPDCYKASVRCDCPLVALFNCKSFTGPKAIMGFNANGTGCLYLDSANTSPYCN